MSRSASPRWRRACATPSKRPGSSLSPRRRRSPRLPSIRWLPEALNPDHNDRSGTFCGTAIAIVATGGSAVKSGYSVLLSRIPAMKSILSGTGLAAALIIAASIWILSMKWELVEVNYIVPSVSASASIPPSAAAAISPSVPLGMPPAAEPALPPTTLATLPMRDRLLHVQVMRHFHKARPTVQLNRKELARIHSGDLRPW
jgi:hypothetical protein